MSILLLLLGNVQQATTLRAKCGLTHKPSHIKPHAVPILLFQPGRRSRYGFRSFPGFRGDLFLVWLPSTHQQRDLRTYASFFAAVTSPPTKC